METAVTPAPEAETPEAKTREVQRDVPPLRNGDRLTRAEFERRYEAMPPRQYRQS